MTWGKLLFFEKTGSIKRRRYASTRDWMEIEKANLYVACRSLEAMWCAVNRVLESRHPDSRQNICRSRFTGRDYILSFRRVWFWLRTNAGGVDKTCKSNEILSKACFAKSSGERVSNTWATCPEAGDNQPKGCCNTLCDYKRHLLWIKAGAFGLALLDGLAAYQLVGEVTAYQGDDG